MRRSRTGDAFLVFPYPAIQRGPAYAQSADAIGYSELVIADYRCEIDYAVHLNNLAAKCCLKMYNDFETKRIKLVHPDTKTDTISSGLHSRHDLKGPEENGKNGTESGPSTLPLFYQDPNEERSADHGADDTDRQTIDTGYLGYAVGNEDECGPEEG